MNTTGLDLPRAHRFFSAECFNRCWSLLEQSPRTAVEARDLELVAMASLWHWTQRADCQPRNLAIGLWQLARVYAVLGQAENALRWAVQCAAASAAEPAFYRGYACEALARAALVAGNGGRAREELAQARSLLEGVADADERALLSRDLADLAEKLP